MHSYTVLDGDSVVAVVVQGQCSEPGVHFFSPPDLSQQIGFQIRRAGERVPLHEHQPHLNSTNKLAEVLIVKRGEMKVTLYTSAGTLLHEVILRDGEMILLESGAHEVQFIGETELYEIKQGPYNGQSEKRWLTRAP
jgi:hypothetical protein